MYVLDTKVISELRKGRRADQSVRMWAKDMPVASLYVSVISIRKLEIGALLARNESLCATTP
jgi:predicted nucleic acid-binding protein